MLTGLIKEAPFLIQQVSHAAPYGPGRPGLPMVEPGLVHDAASVHLAHAWIQTDTQGEHFLYWLSSLAVQIMTFFIVDVNAIVVDAVVLFVEVLLPVERQKVKRRTLKSSECVGSTCTVYSHGWLE